MAFGLGLGNVAGSVGAGDAIFKAVGYVGNGSTQAITGVGFQPDLTWIKNRDAADFHVLVDSTVGTGKYWRSDAGNFGYITNANSVTAFNTGGFSIGNQAEVNTNTENYISWNFKKDAEVFDIVAYAGNGTTQNVPHNMSVTPEIIIVTGRTGQSAFMYHKNLNNSSSPANYAIQFDFFIPEAVSSKWNNTAPTSSVFSLGNDSVVNGLNDYIAYLFASKTGVSKVGTYSGTGSSNAITGLGFAPSYVMVRRRVGGTIDGWEIYDSTRGDDLNLKSNSVAVEGSLALTLDADGFTVNSSHNVSGTNNYIYLAMA